MRQAKPGDETIDMPVLFGGVSPIKCGYWIDDVAAVLAGDREKPETWRLGFVEKDYWFTHTKTVDNQLLITLPK